MTAELEPSETKDAINAATLEKLLKINQSLLTTQDLVVLLEQIAEGAHAVLGADVVVLYVYEEERDDVMVPPVIAGTLLTGEVLRTTSQKRPHRESAVFKMLYRTEPLYAENAREDWPRQMEGWSWEGSFLQREDIVSSAAIPLTTNEKVAGVLFINYRTHRSFSESERRVVELFASSAAIAIQNAQQAERERTLREVSQAISSAEELKADAEAILDRLCQIVKYRTASLQLIQGDDETRRLLATRGFEAETADSWFLRPVSHDPLILQIVESKKPVILSDTNSVEGWNDYPGTEKVKSWAGVPLVYGQDVVGLLTIDHDEPGFYTEAIRDVLVSFAHEVAVHVRNARVFDNTQRRIRDLEIVNHVVQVLGSEIEPGKIMKAVVSEIATRLDCTHCTIFLPEEENGEVVLAAAETYGRRREQILARRFKPGEGLAGWVFQRGEPLLLGNASGDPRFAPATDPGAQPRSMMVVPVIVGDETIGVISSDQDRLAWFGESDLRLLTALARHAGVALQRASGLDLLHDISNRIVSALDVKVEEILEEIVKGALKLTRTSTAVIFLIAPDGRTVLRTVERPEGFHHPDPRMEGGITREIIDTRKEMVFPDVRQDPRVNPEMHDRVRSMIGIPLIGGDRVVGVLFVNDKEPHEFTGFEISLLKALANEGATAVQNARLFESLKLLNQVESDLASTLDEQKIVETVVQSAASTFECTHCTVFQVQGNRMVVTASKGNRGDSVEIGRTFNVGQGIAGWVARTGEPRHVSDTAKDPDFAPGWSTPQADPGSLIVVPIFLETGTYGVISVEHDQAHSFDEHDLRLLETLGLQVTQAIRNARLYRAQERLSIQLERLHQVVQEEGLQVVLDRIVEGVCAILGEGVSPTINLYREDTGKFGQRHACGPLTDSLRDLPRPAGTGAHVVATREPLYLDDVFTPPDGCPTIRQESIERGVVSFAAIPLIRERQIVGALFVNSQKAVKFSTEIKRILELFGGQAAIAIHVHQELERKICELEALTEIGKTVSNLGIDQILDLVYKEATKVMDLRDAQVQIAFYDQDKDMVQFPLAVEQDNGRIIDTVRWGERLDKYRRAALCLARLEWDVAAELEEETLSTFSIDKLDEQGVMLSKDVIVTTRVPGMKWQIFDQDQLYIVERGQALDVWTPEQDFLLSLPPEFQSGLDRGMLPSPFYSELDDLGVELSSDAKLVVHELGQQWWLMDGSNRYVIKLAPGVRLYEAESRSVIELQPRARGTRFGLTEFVIQKKEPFLIVEDFVEQATELKIQVWPTFGRDSRPTHSWLGVPMIVQDRVIGIISIQSLEQEHAFDKGHVELLWTIATQAAVAIENARLYEDNQRMISKLELTVSQLRLIREHALEMSRELDLADVLRKTATAANEVMDADFTTVFAYSREQGFEQGARTGIFTDVPNLPDLKSWEGQIVQQPAPHKVEAIRDSALSPEFAARTGVQSYVSQPVYFAGKPVGLMLVNYILPHTFTSDEMEWLELLANQAAVAIQNARSFARVEEVERGEAMNLVAADVLHRVGNYLGSIQTRLQLVKKGLLSLEKQWDPKEITADLDDILVGIDDTKVAIQNTLDHPSDGKPELVQLDVLLQSALIRIEASSPRDIRFAYDVKSDLPPVLCHSTQLYEAIHAILDNAVDAVLESDDQRNITVSLDRITTETDKPFAQIIVKDTGAGIPESEIPHLFELWYTTKSDGTGYGLWRARSIVRQLGGELGLESGPGKGTQAVVTVPLARTV